MKEVGYLWNDKEIKIVEVDGEMYALYGWNGEAYCHCWKVLDSDGLNRVEEEREYILEPVVKGVGTPNEDGEYDEYENVDYKVSIL